jgi:hypothetical protein
MLLACLQVVVLFSVAHLGFGMPLGNSPLGLVAITVAVAFVATALGMFVATLAKNADQAGNIGSILAFVMGGVGGSIPIGRLARLIGAHCAEWLRGGGLLSGDGGKGYPDPCAAAGGCAGSHGVGAFHGGHAAL